MMRHILSFWTEERSLTIFLALLVVQIFIIAPLETTGRLLLYMLNGVVGSLFLLTGLLTITQHRLIRLVAACLVACALIARWLALISPSPLMLIADNLFAICFAGCFTAVVLQKVYEEGAVSAHRVRGAIAAYLLIGYFFAAVYRLLDALIAGSFSHAASPAFIQQGKDLSDVFMYFSLVTLTTVGFGDISAVHPVARSLVMLEAVIGTLYPAILIARLVSLNIEHEKQYTPPESSTEL
jgi:hypothetical protein